MHHETARDYNPMAELEEKISLYQAELDKLKSKRTFPYVYIVVAIPTTILFMVLTVISEGLIDFTTGITGALFFSLLITCSYLVLFQPNQEELAEELNRKIRNLYREKAKLEAGLRGEREVAYILRWLPPNYLSIHNVTIPSERFEQQQIDHMVVGPNGLFHLETKSINGVVMISPGGEWTVIKPVQNRMVKEGMDSPRLQVQRHETVLKEFLRSRFKFDIPVVSVVVMAHPSTIIEGEDPSLNVVKKDRLNEFIQSYQGSITLTQKQVRQITLALAEASVENTAASRDRA